jgi:Effector-associated domain 1
MATQQTGTPPKTRRLGIFPDSIRNFVIVIMIVLFVIFGIIGVIGILRGWNTVFNVLFMIFAVTSAILAILTFWQSNNPNEAPASASHKSRRQYRLKSNISLTIGQKDTTQSTSESLVNNVAKIETDKQSFTSPGDQTPRGERSASPLPNTRPTITQASSSPVYSGGFPQRENTRPGITLTHQEQSDLTDALLKVYPNQEDFEMMFERKFERKLNTVIDGGNYRTRVYRLLEWTEAEGRTYDLIRSAHDERPRNPALQRELARKIRSWIWRKK